jgi:hypothetical protein
VFQEELVASTTLGAVKHLLQEKFDIPLSIQSHFKDFHTGSNGGYGYDQERLYEDEITLREVWEDMHEEDHEDWGYEWVLVTLATTAGRLWEMDRVGTKTMVAEQYWNWRHYGAALRYLANKREMPLDSGKREEIEAQFSEYERLERSTAESIRKSIWDWYRLVDNVVTEPTKENETLEARAQDIENRFRQWMKDKRKGLQVLDKEAKAAELEILRKENPTIYASRSAKSQESQVSYAIPAPRASLLKFNFPPEPPGKPQTISLPIRDSLDRLLPKSSSFTVTSGILLWGQLNTVFAGSIDPTFQGNAENAPAELAGGTIWQYPVRYRSAARNGMWKVRKIFSNRNWEHAECRPWQFGWLVYHEHVDAVKAVERCTMIHDPSGKRHGNQHVDKVSTRSRLTLSLTIQPSILSS